ncbi:histidine phosphatase superfamily [Aspergillus germanicus]
MTKRGRPLGAGGTMGQYAPILAATYPVCPRISASSTHERISRPRIIRATWVSAILSTASVAAGAYQPFAGFQEKQFQQTFYDGFNLLKFTASCEVDQVILFIRHGERYPDMYNAVGYLAALDKMYSSNITNWAGDSAFVDDWTYFIDDQGLYSQESTTGPYAGLTNAYRRGADYRSRYGHLWGKESIIPIFTTGVQRVVNTARNFGEGFLGYNYSTNAAINIISRMAIQGANSLKPDQNPGLNLNGTDVVSLMHSDIMLRKLAAFELNIRPYSPWMNAFTPDEWVAFGYYVDLIYYSGPGQGTMFWNFAHDADVAPVIAALGLDSTDKPLPKNWVVFPHNWHASNLVPMGGHLTLERLSCNKTVISDEGIYVRAIINEANAPWTDCQSGPGFVLGFGSFLLFISRILLVAP